MKRSAFFQTPVVKPFDVLVGQFGLLGPTDYAGLFDSEKLNLAYRLATKYES